MFRSAPFRDRQDAGRQLADKLAKYKNIENGLIIALPRGGLPVAKEVATSLNLPLDVVVPRKIGHPSNPEFAVGALTETGEVFFNEEALGWSGLSPNSAAIRRIVEEEKKEAKRRVSIYRGGRESVQLRNKTAIIVDDGIATGATMKAAVKTAKSSGADKVVVAVPVGAPDSLDEVKQMADEVVAVMAPRHLSSVGQWYQTFGQTSDEEVMEIMRQYGPQSRSSESHPSALKETAHGGGMQGKERSESEQAREKAIAEGRQEREDVRASPLKSFYPREEQGRHEEHHQPDTRL